MDNKKVALDFSTAILVEAPKESAKELTPTQEIARVIEDFCDFDFDAESGFEKIDHMFTKKKWFGWALRVSQWGLLDDNHALFGALLVWARQRYKPEHERPIYRIEDWKLVPSEYGKRFHESLPRFNPQPFPRD